MKIKIVVEMDVDSVEFAKIMRDEIEEHLINGEINFEEVRIEKV